MILSISDMLLGKIPESMTAVAGKKKGRGRPRKIVKQEGINVYKKADIKSTFKQLTPKIVYEIRHRYSQLEIQEPSAGIVWRCMKIAKEFNLTYTQVFKLVV